MNRTELEQLLERYRNGECVDQELEMLQEQIFNTANKPVLTENELSLLKNEARVQLHELINPIQTKRINFLSSVISTVAAAITLIVVGVWLFNVSPSVNHIVPGKNKATLTIKDGASIQLSDAKAGVIIGNDLKYSDGTTIILNQVRDLLNSTGNGDLSSGRDDGQAIEMTARTPRGGTYIITLSDGTKVWLNADSKLEFLSNFRNVARRIVKLTGEGYFEVAKDKLHPFVVESRGQQVTVLGTHFNVSAYEGEKIKTTLLEGIVKVSLDSLGGMYSKSGDRVLKPGQQAILAGNPEVGFAVTVKQIDASESIAWKEGKFVFADETIQSIMQKIARWYDVEIEYKEIPVYNNFSGSISRFEDISRLLRKIEMTNKVHFKIKGRRIIVLK